MRVNTVSAPLGIKQVLFKLILDSVRIRTLTFTEIIFDSFVGHFRLKFPSKVHL